MLFTWIELFDIRYNLLLCAAARKSFTSNVAVMQIEGVGEDEGSLAQFIDHDACRQGDGCTISAGDALLEAEYAVLKRLGTHH